MCLLKSVHSRLTVTTSLEKSSEFDCMLKSKKKIGYFKEKEIQWIWIHVSPCYEGGTDMRSSIATSGVPCIVSVGYKLSAWLFLWSLIRVIVILCTSNYFYDHWLESSPYSVHHFHDCVCVLPNCWESIILMMVVATESVDDMPSKQFTTVPFRPLLTGLTATLDIRGELSWQEGLEKVIMELLKVSGGGTPLGPADETGIVV